MQFSLRRLFFFITLAAVLLTFGRPVYLPIAASCSKSVKAALEHHGGEVLRDYLLFGLTPVLQPLGLSPETRVTASWEEYKYGPGQNTPRYPYGYSNWWEGVEVKLADGKTSLYIEEGEPGANMLMFFRAAAAILGGLLSAGFYVALICGFYRFFKWSGNPPERAKV